MIYDCETKKIQGFIPLIRNSDQTEFSLVTMISKRYKTLSERTVGRRCIRRMRGFFVSGTCECRNVVNFWLVDMGEKDVEP